MNTPFSKAAAHQNQSISHLSDSDLLRRAREISLEERKAGIALLHHLCEIERRRLYAVKFASLHEYVVRELGYSDGAAHRRISAMRLMKVAPEVEKKLEQGTLTLSTASQIQHFLKTEKRITGVAAPIAEVRSILTQVEGKSSRQTEAYFAARSPQVAELMRERPRAIDGEKIQVNVVLSASLQEKLKRLRDRMAHQNSSPSLAEQIEQLADFALRKLEGNSARRERLSRPERQNVNPAERPVEDGLVNAALRQPTEQIEELEEQRHRSLEVKNAVQSKHRRVISVQNRREVWRRADARCEQKFSNGERCSRTHLLQVDHRIPVAWGGGNELSNLQLLCSTHNRVKSDRLPGEY